MGFLSGKRALIAGLASNRSIAWGIAEAMHREGAELAFTYPNEKLGERVSKLAAKCDSTLILPCDVSSDEQIEAIFDELGKHWDGLDIIVHSIAFAPADQLAGDYLDCVNREGFRIAHDISSYSFAAMAKAGRSMMAGRNLAQSLGPQGIRVNAISAGPIRTLAAAGISNFRKMLDTFANTAPLRRNVTIEDVGNAAAFLCSDLAAGITGEITYVDGGYSTVGMPPMD
jgi:enoyl-[acyl-carrier protein] reductase I